MSSELCNLASLMPISFVSDSLVIWVCSPPPLKEGQGLLQMHLFRNHSEWGTCNRICHMGINLLDLQRAGNHVKTNGSERSGQPQLLESILYPLSFPSTKIAMGSKGINVQGNIGFLFPDLQRKQHRNQISCSSTAAGERRWVGWMWILRLSFPLLAVGGGRDPTRSKGTACPESGWVRDRRKLGMVFYCLATSLLLHISVKRVRTSITSVEGEHSTPTLCRCK